MEGQEPIFRNQILTQLHEGFERTNLRINAVFGPPTVQSFRLND